MTTTPVTTAGTEVNVLYSGFGTMPTLMASKQIDAYIAWQPYVEVAPMAGFGRVLSYTGELPPIAKMEEPSLLCISDDIQHGKGKS